MDEELSKYREVYQGLVNEFEAKKTVELERVVLTCEQKIAVLSEKIKTNLRGKYLEEFRRSVVSALAAAKILETREMFYSTPNAFKVHEIVELILDIL